MIKAPLLLGLIFLILVSSCGKDNSENSIEELAAYCIRECVLETSDSEICDEKCKCAANKLSGELSKYKNSVENISQDADLLQKLQRAVDECSVRAE